MTLELGISTEFALSTNSQRDFCLRKVTTSVWEMRFFSVVYSIDGRFPKFRLFKFVINAILKKSFTEFFTVLRESLIKSQVLKFGKSQVDSFFLSAC